MNEESLILKIQKFDEAISKKIVQKFEKRQGLLAFISLSGNSQPWLIISLSLFIFDVFLSRVQNLLQVVSGLIFASVIGLIKIAVKRERPNHSMTKKFISKADYYSFPSGHSTRVMVFSIMLTYYFPSICWIFILWGLLVAFTRIALDLHYFCDVVVGIIIGIIGGIAGIVLYNSLSPLLNKVSFFA